MVTGKRRDLALLITSMMPAPLHCPVPCATRTPRGMSGRVRTDFQLAETITALRHNVPSGAALTATLIGTVRHISSPRRGSAAQLPVTVRGQLVPLQAWRPLRPEADA